MGLSCERPGPSATLRLLLRVPSGKALFHEAGVYLANSHSVYISSNRLPCERGRQYATITRVPVDKIPAPAFGKVDRPSIVEPLQDAAKLWHELEIVKDLPQDLAMPNGAAPWKSLSNGQQEGVLWCAQGHHDLDGDGSPEVESALVCMTVDERGRPSETEVALDAFQGKRFSSLNDVVIHAQSGCVFFTDPDYGIGQSFKRSGVGVDGYAPNALYVWHPASGEVRMVDDDYHERECAILHRVELTSRVEPLLIVLSTTGVVANGVTFVRDPSDPTSGKGYLVTTDTGRFTFKANGNMGVLIVDETRPACVYTYIIEPSPHPALDPFPIVRVDERQLLWESECGAPDGVHPDDNGNM